MFHRVIGWENSMAEETSAKEISKVDAEEQNVFYADSEEEAKALALAHFMQPAGVCKEEIVRPSISFAQWFFGLILPLMSEAANLLIYFFAFAALWLVIPLAFLIVLLFIKPEFILFVLLYQKFAPASLRASCRFEPSCSNYMLLAIKKYGFFKGFFKGIRRLLRCRYPNGGIDYP